MNEKQEYYYRVLGLKSGATPGEVKSAYRRLVKLYHPDRDNSPDTLSMYKEIHKAYKALFNQASANETDVNSVINRNYSKMTSQDSNYSTKRAQQSNANSSKKTSQNSSSGSERVQQSNTNNSSNFNHQSAGMFEELKIKYKRKIPFEFQNLLLIFKHSLRELFADYNYILFPIKVLFVSPFVIFVCVSMFYEGSNGPRSHEPAGNLLVSFYITSLVFFIYFRYYFKPSTWSPPARIIAAIMYGTILPLLIAYHYPLLRDFLGGMGLIFIWLFTAIPVWILMLSGNYDFLKE